MNRHWQKLRGLLNGYDIRSGATGGIANNVTLNEASEHTTDAGRTAPTVKAAPPDGAGHMPEAAQAKRHEPRILPRWQELQGRLADKLGAAGSSHRGKQRNSGKRRHIVLWWLLGIAALLSITAAVVLDFGAWVGLDEAKLLNLRRTTLMYDSGDAEVAGLYLGENRMPVDVSKLPAYVRYAFVAAEDARFYAHHGVDLWRIGGAIMANLKSGGYSEGASTISQQLIKLTHLSPKKTLARKANEAMLALALEARYPKDKILEMYMNTVYFGHGAYGIEAAARAYFSKKAPELTLAESALLAAVIKSSAGFAPHIHPEKALARRNRILADMHELHYISPQEYAAAVKQPLKLKESHKSMPEYGWYIDYALSEAEKLLDLKADELISGGYRIYTAMDTALQDRAQRVFKSAEFPPDSPDGTPCQGAFCAVDNRSGAILAMIGGRRYDVRRGLNRACDVKRQPGSAIKPLAVYAPAIDSFGYLPSSFLSDAPTEFNGWFPHNAGGRYRGIVTLRQAMAASINVAAVGLLDNIGVKAGIDFLNSVGIATDSRDEFLPLALGAMTYGVSPLELCGAVSTFAREGLYTKPHAIRYILDAQGQIIYVHKGEYTRVMAKQSAYMMTEMMQSVVRQGTASRLRALDMPIGAKTGTAALDETATGITGNRDIWLTSAVPSMTTTVWMGFDRTDSTHFLPDSASGSNQPARLTAALMQSAEARRYTQGSFSRPAGIREVMLDGWALDNLHVLMLAGADTPSNLMIREIFPSESVPEKVSMLFCDALLPYDLEAGFAETGRPFVRFTCPEEYVEYRVYRSVGPTRELAGILKGREGDKLALTDYDAPDAASIRYEVAAYSPARDMESEGTSAVVIERSLWHELGRLFGRGYIGEELPIFTAAPAATRPPVLPEAGHTAAPKPAPTALPYNMPQNSGKAERGLPSPFAFG